MKKLILTLALAAIAPLAFAQSIEVKTDNGLKFKRERIEHRDGGRFFHRDREIEFTVHPREYWTRRYREIRMIEGCYYYRENGCWYPANGYDPSCKFQDRVVYCE